MSADRLFDEITGHLERAGIEIRVEPFRTPPDSAGGLCIMKGSRLVLLHSGASRPEQTQALLEVLERIGFDELARAGVRLSPELLVRLNRRGHIRFPQLRLATSSAPLPVGRASSVRDDE